MTISFPAATQVLPAQSSCSCSCIISDASTTQWLFCIHVILIKDHNGIKVGRHSTTLLQEAKNTHTHTDAVKNTLTTTQHSAAPTLTSLQQQQMLQSALKGTHPKTLEIRRETVKRCTTMCQTSYTRAALSSRAVKMTGLSSAIGRRYM